MRPLAEARLALMLLTRLPVGRLRDPVPGIAQSVWAFPLAGLAVGAAAALVAVAAVAIGLPVAVAAGLALTAQVLATGGLHEDGLADLCDGFWGGPTAERRLQIMRDSRIGSYGALGLILSLGLRWSALAALLAAGPAVAAAAIIAAAMASRIAPVALMAGLAPARADGLGHAAGAPRLRQVIVAVALGAVAVLLFPQGLAALCLAGLAVAGLGLIAWKKIGGQSGDVLGAGQQVAEIVLLMVLSLH